MQTPLSLPHDADRDLVIKFSNSHNCETKPYCCIMILSLQSDIKSRLLPMSELEQTSCPMRACWSTIHQHDWVMYGASPRFRRLWSRHKISGKPCTTGIIDVNGSIPIDVCIFHRSSESDWQILLWSLNVCNPDKTKSWPHSSSRLSIAPRNYISRARESLDVIFVRYSWSFFRLVLLKIL